MTKCINFCPFVVYYSTIQKTEQDEEVDIRQFFGKILIEHPDQEELSFHNERIFTMEFDPEMVKKCKVINFLYKNFQTRIL